MAIFGKQNNISEDSGRRSASSSGIASMFQLPPLRINKNLTNYVQKGIFKEIGEMKKNKDLSPTQIKSLLEKIDSLSSIAATDLSQQHLDRLSVITSNTMEMESYIYELNCALNDLEEEIVKVQKEISDYDPQPEQAESGGNDADAAL